MSDETKPSQEQIREARHAGFNDSVSHMPAEKRDHLTSAFTNQDGRREKNISSFYGNVLGN